MARMKIKANLRGEKGKGAVKKLKKEGYIPAVMYSKDVNLVLSIPITELKQMRSIGFSESTVIDMEIEGKKKPELIPTLIKKLQFHPLTEEVIHIDFLKVSLEEKIKVHVPVVLRGESKGVKEGAGVLEQILRELEIEGLPLDIPEKIEVDISELDVGHSLHVANLNVADNLRIVTDPSMTIITVVAMKEEEEAEVVPEEEAVLDEPEVIKEKKEAPQGKVEKEK